MKRRLQGHEANGKTLEKLDLRNMSAFQSKWRGCSFAQCTMGLSFFKGSVFGGTSLSACDMPLCDFSGAIIDGTSFSGCVMDQSSFAGAILTDVTYTACQLSLSSFSGATLRKVRFLDCNLYGVDLDILEGKGNEFRGNNMWGTRIPNNCQFWNSSVDDKTCRMFVGLVARVMGDMADKEALIEIAGHEYTLVDRLMSVEEEGSE